MEDEAFRTALRKSEERLFGEWIASESTQQRERIHARCMALREIATALNTIYENGQVEEHLLAEQE